MLSMDIPDELWWEMCDAQMSHPVPLNEADLTKPFIYDREHGLFYVLNGYHQRAMTVLLCYELNEYNTLKLAEKLNIRYDKISDKWLEGKGRCFKSSVASSVYAGFKGNLTVIEAKLFDPVKYVLDD